MFEDVSLLSSFQKMKGSSASFICIRVPRKQSSVCAQAFCLVLSGILGKGFS